MSPEEANKTLLNTDYPLDKIVYMDSGSILVPNNNSIFTYIPHSLSFIPLVTVTWSLTPNFETSFSTGFPPYRDISDTSAVTVWATITDLVIYPLNDTGSTKTYYWRAYGQMPSDVNDETGHTSNATGNFVMNTDYNYSKLYLNDKTPYIASPYIVSHNLGYIPRQVSIWRGNLDGEIEPVFDGTTEPTDNSRIIIDNTNLYFYSTSGSSYYYYRIYLDE